MKKLSGLVVEFMVIGCSVNVLSQDEKAKSLQLWANEYMNEDFLDKLDLEFVDLEKLSELFYKNIKFLKKHKNLIFKELNNHNDIKKFLV